MRLGGDMADTRPDKSDRKRVTLREVAQEAGVSLKTASNVINHSGRMADATREKVQDVIDRLGYRVNVSARNLNRGKTGFITLAVPSLTAPRRAIPVRPRCHESCGDRLANRSGTYPRSA